MGVETEEDRLAFLAVEEFGVYALYTPAVGAAVSISVIFDKAWESIDLDAPVPVSSRQPKLECRTIDLVNGGTAGQAPEARDTFTIGGTVYAAVDIKPDGTGMTAVMLEET